MIKYCDFLSSVSAPLFFLVCEENILHITKLKSHNHKYFRMGWLPLE